MYDHRWGKHASTPPPQMSATTASMELQTMQTTRTVCFHFHRAAIFAITIGFVACAHIFGADKTDQPPELQISNGVVTAKLYLPDTKVGYYRGTRFDWSGVIHSLAYAGHEYFGEWQKSDDPYLHDRITGPVDSFGANTDIDVGETFLRIGVGVCEKMPTDKSKWKHPHRVVDHGNWSMKHGANWTEMSHEITVAKTKQGYRYTKRLTLTPGRPELVIDHALTNTGQTDIETDVYNHNFFVIDGQPTGPDFVVRFPFELTADRDLRGIGQVRKNELTYLREMPDGSNVFTLLTGFGSSGDDNRFTLENRKVKAGVHMVADRAISKIQFWSPRTTVCPEPFIDLKIKPNHSDRWSIRYTFFTLGE